MEILGYSDPLSVRPGQSIDFMVSCEAESYRADIVRLIHGDENPLGPGFVEEELGSDADGVYAGKVQPIAAGSAVEVPDDPALRPARICVVAHVLATTPVGRRQGIITKTSPDGDIGYGLFLDEGGHAEFVVGTATGFGVTGGAEGVGRATTKAVVRSITAIVIADMLFSFFLNR